MDWIFNNIGTVGGWIVCFVLCAAITGRSIVNAQKNIVDEGAPLVLAIGVLGTFFGITYSLLHFDANSDTMVQQIAEFIAGIETAFVTSIIGVISSIVIKLLQSSVEQREGNDIQLALDTVNSINEIKEALTINNTMLSGVNDKLDKLDNAALVDELRTLNKTMTEFVDTNASGAKIIEELNKQTMAFSGLSRALSDAVSEFGNVQRDQLDKLDKNLGGKLDQLNGSFAGLGGAIESVRTEIIDGVSTLKDELKPLGEAHEGSDGSLTMLGDQINNSITLLGDQLVGSLDSVREDVKTLNETVGNSVGGMVTQNYSNFEKLGGLLGAISGVIEDAVGKTRTDISEAVAGLEGSIENVQSAINQNGAEITAALVGLQEALEKFKAQSRADLKAINDLSEAIALLNDEVTSDSTKP